MSKVASKTIELTDVVRSLWFRASLWSLKLTLFSLLCVAVLFFAAYHVDAGRKIATGYIIQGWQSVVARFASTQIVREYIPASQASIPELIASVSREFKLHPVILQAIVLKESSGGNSKFLYRFEPGVFAARANTDKRSTEDERRMLSSSHGITQVMGYNALPRCSVHWSSLYDNATALRCAAIIIRENLGSVSGVRSPVIKLREALRRYNGSGEMAERYADSVMAGIGELLFAQLKEEL